jgi:hypothetical protein
MIAPGLWEKRERIPCGECQFLFLAAASPNGGDTNEIWRLAKAPAVSTD